MGPGHTMTNKKQMGQKHLKELDLDWVELMLTARYYGLSTEEVHSFLKEAAVSSSGDR